MGGRAPNHLITLAVLVQVLLLRVRLGVALGSHYKGDMLGHTLGALGDLDAVLRRWTRHPALPAWVGGTYDRVCASVVQWAAPPAAAAAPAPAPG
jgi:hypothetical protein